MTNNIDKRFKEKLDGYASDVAPAIWEGIAGKMKRQRQLRYLLILFALFTIASLSLYFLTKSSKDNTEVETESFAGKSIEQTESTQIKRFADGIEDSEIENTEDEKLIDNNRAVVSSKHQNDFNLSPGVSKDVELELSKAVRHRSSNSFSPAPTATVQFRASKSFRCNIHPEPLDNQKYYLDYDWFKNQRSKTLGDCFEGPPNKFMIGFNASLDFPFRKINGLSGSELGDYINERNATESEFVSYNAGIQAGYFHPSGLSIRSGMQYTQINERFLLVKENVIKIQTQITIDTMINSDGSYTIHRDTSIVEVLGREELKTSNHFKMLDIPLVLGYTFDFRRLSMEVNGGVIFNITSQSGGRILNTDLVPSYFGTKSPAFQPFKTHYGVSLYGSVTLLSNFYGRTQLFLEPNARYYLKSFSSSEYPVRQKYLVVGLSTGVRYYF